MGKWYLQMYLRLSSAINRISRKNAYVGTAVVRIKGDKLYLYDIINIKKEASTPL